MAALTLPVRHPWAVALPLPVDLRSARRASGLRVLPAPVVRAVRVAPVALEASAVLARAGRDH